MNILLYGKNAGHLSPLLPKFGLTEVKENPDVVISYGGDGTYLLSEVGYPGVPKVMIRDSKICKKCVNLPIEETLKRLSGGQYIENKLIKLEANYGDKKYTVVNDVVVAHTTPTSAIRYKIYINNIPYIDGREIVGDGIVVASPFGSGAYYRSITDGVFSVGIGLAFNNSTEQVDHIVLRESDEIRFELTRGHAVLAIPGHEPERIAEGDSLTIKTSKEMGKVLTFGEEFSYWAN
jgi:NAD+ kinase